MFLSYEYTYFGRNDITDQPCWEYKIVDSEFEEVVAGCDSWSTIIAIYEKRNLNVAANLIKAFLFMSEKSGWPINKIIDWNKQYNPKFHKYEAEVNKYLMLV